MKKYLFILWLTSGSLALSGQPEQMPDRDLAGRVSLGDVEEGPDRPLPIADEAAFRRYCAYVEAAIPYFLPELRGPVHDELVAYKQSVLRDLGVKDAVILDSGGSGQISVSDGSQQINYSSSRSIVDALVFP